MASIRIIDPTFWSTRKAISALYPYAVLLARDGQLELINAVSRVVSKSTSVGSVWHRIRPYINTWFDESSPAHLNQAIILVTPCIYWGSVPLFLSFRVVTRWAAAASATPYSEEVGARVVDALLQFSRFDILLQRIPIHIWAWLKRQPSLPPLCQGRTQGITSDNISQIRGLGDIEIFKSYLHLVWSEWNFFNPVPEVQLSIKEDLGGIGLWCHRESLIKRLEHILGQLDMGLEYLQHHQPLSTEDEIQRRREGYEGLRKVLVEVDREATDILSRKPPD